MDAVHPTQATEISSGRIKKGSDKTINTTGSRSRLNIVGAIELGNLSIDHFFDETLPDIADSLTSRINDNFQRLKPAF